MESVGSDCQPDICEKNGMLLKVYNNDISIEAINNLADVYKKVSDSCSIAPKFYGIEEEDGKHIFKLECFAGVKLSEAFGKSIFKYRKNTHSFGKLHREINNNSASGLITTKEKFGKALLQYKDIREDSLNKLIAFIDKPGEQSLCHGELSLDNVIVDDKGKMRVSDWEKAHCGDPLSDVAYAYYLLKHITTVGEGKNKILKTDIQTRQYLGRAYLKSYFGAKKIPVRDLDIWGLIIRMYRYLKTTEEEKEDLQKAIDIGIKKLLED